MKLTGRLHARGRARTRMTASPPPPPKDEIFPWKCVPCGAPMETPAFNDPDDRCPDCKTKEAPLP